MTAVLYNYGRGIANEELPNNKYSGYYYFRAGDPDKNGIVIQHSNGYEEKTNFYGVSNADNALLNVIRPTK